jgi:hypothetical protein
VGGLTGRTLGWPAREFAQQVLWKGRESSGILRPAGKAEQRRRFEELSRELGCDDGQALDRAFSKISAAENAF